MAQQAHIFQINASQGGVPKLPQREAEVNALGLANDSQRDTKYHGGPERALCLFSLERILALQAEGHPIYPGSVGENVTISGLDWSHVAPATQMRLGEVLIEVMSYVAPCANIVKSFVAGDYSHISQKRHPGWARVYVRVLQPGYIRVGDAVIIVG